MSKSVGHTTIMKPSLVVIGLGNPGKEYKNTRHNVGFLAVDFLREKFGGGEWSEKEKFHADIAEATVQSSAVLFVKPRTFMNRSGECIRKIVDFYKLDPSQQILVIVDDIDLPLGTHRMRETGGPGTHNGLKSIVETLGENFPRFRIGIGAKPEGEDLATWVLSNLSKQETKTLHQSFLEAEKILNIKKT